MDIKAKENVKERNEIKSFLSCSVLVLFFNEDLKVAEFPKLALKHGIT